MRAFVASLMLSGASSASATEYDWLEAFELCRMAIEKVEPLRGSGLRSLSAEKLAEFAVPPQVTNAAGREFVVSPGSPQPNEGWTIDGEVLQVLIWDRERNRVCEVRFPSSLEAQEIEKISMEFSARKRKIIDEGTHVNLDFPRIPPVVMNGFALNGLNFRSSCVVSVISFDTEAGYVSIKVGEQTEDACRITKQVFSN